MRSVKKKKHGFTLVELLVVISILAILTLIAIPTLRAFQARNDRAQYINYKKSIIVSGKLYNDSYNDDIFGHATYGCEKVSLTELINKKIGKDIPLKGITCNNKSRDSFAIIKKFNNEYAYESYISCENEKGVIQYSDLDELTDQCVTDTGMPVITVTTNNAMADNTKKKSVIIHLHDNYGFTSKQSIEYAWSTSTNANGVTNYEAYNYNNSYIKTTGSEVVLDSHSITMKGSETATYYLYVKPIKVQNILNNSLTEVVRFGPFRFDHTAPECPAFSAIKEDGTSVNEAVPARGIKIQLKFGADDLQNYDYQISYDNGSTWSSTITKDKSNLTIVPVNDGKVKVRVKGRDNANNLYSNWCTSGAYYNDNTPPTVPTVKGYKRTTSTNATSKGSMSEVSDNTWINAYSYVEASGTSDYFTNNPTYYYSTSGTHGTNNNVKSKYVNVNNEGVSTVKFKTCDTAGNCSGWASYTVKLDRTAPSGLTLTGYVKKNATDVSSGSGLSAYTANTWSNKWVVVVASGASDALGNGVNYYSGSTKTNYVNVNNQGTTIVKMKVCDNLSNCTSESSFLVKLDRCESTSIKWNSWGTCSKSCGTGTQSRTGTKYSTVTGHTDYVCGSGVNKETSSQNCNTQDCCSSTSNFDCGSWAWSSCTKSCGSGTKYQYRTCKKKSNYDGSTCPGTATEKKSEGTACNTQECCSSTTNYDCGSWSWSDCTKSCG